jgi:hypothetical protein
VSYAEFVELSVGESVVPDDSNPTELLFRQIVRNVWDAQHNKPNLHAFGPQKSDERKPSFSRSSATTAQQSRDWHNSNARSKSHGVWACSVAEIRDARTRAIDDSETPLSEGEIRAPGHAFVDYRHADKLELKAIKARLLMAALERKEISTVDNSSDDDDPESGSASPPDSA